MSFLSDLFEGKTSNLGNDLNPSNIFSDAGKDIGGKYTVPELLGGAALLTGGIGLAGGLGAVGADLGIGAAAGAGAPLDILGAGGIDASAAATAGADAAAGGLSADELATAGTLPDWLGTTSFGSTLDAAGGAALPANATLDSLTLPSAANAASDASSIDSLASIGPGTDAGAPLNLLSGGTDAASKPSFISQLIGGASNSLTKNPLGIAVAGGALGYDILKGNPNSASENQLNSEAQTLIGQGQQLTANGQQLQTYLTNGTLPPGQQAAVTQAVQAAKAKIIANAAANGQNTNPTQNSALAQDLAAADMQGLSMAGTLETQLAQTGTSLINSGLNATGLSSEIYQALVKIDQTNNNQLMTAIASMAAALGGGTKISTGGNTFSITPSGA
jgi:hypothetical protein